MKVTIKLFLITASTLFLFGCGKKENPPVPVPQTPATENNASTADIPIPPTEETVVQPPMTTPQTTVELATAAPLKGLEWVKGGPVTIEPGKIYVIEFWATWCGPCKISIPHLAEIQKKYNDKNLTVVGISTEDLKTVKPFVEKMGDQMDYAVAVDKQGFVDKNYMTAFGVQGIPHAFLVDEKGKIVWQGHPMDDLDAVLELVVQGTFNPAAYAKQKAAAEALRRQLMSLYTEYFQKIKADGLTDDIKQIGIKFIEQAPVDGLNAFAWNILAQVEEKDRDMEAALNAAQKASQLSDGKEPAVLDTYARALFDSGKVQEAVDTQQKAVDLLKDDPTLQNQLRQTLDQYKAAQQ